MENVPHHARVAIIGTGFGGLAVAMRLLRDGHGSLVLFERADAVGGVWRDNVYPGAACDVESHLYTLAAAPHGGWSRRFSRQPEIQAYLERVAHEHGVLPHVRFRHDVQRAVWDDAAAVWRVTTSQGEWTADVLVSAAGALAEPRLPDLPGRDSFAGPMLHTSRWDADVALDGVRVAVVGTGASAVQLVPEIQPRVAHLTLFQRTPASVIPRRDRALGGGRAGRARLLRAHRGALYGRHEVLGSPSATARSGPPPTCSRACTSAARSPTRSCAAGSRRRAASGASGSCSRTTTTPRSRSPT